MSAAVRMIKGDEIFFKLSPRVVEEHLKEIEEWNKNHPEDEQIHISCDPIQRPSLVNAERCKVLIEEFGALSPPPVLVPVRSIPGAKGCVNYIGEAFALEIAERTGFQVADPRVIRSNYLNRTTTSDASRFVKHSTYEGPLRIPNAILVDDTCSAGGTLLALKAAITRAGGNVIGCEVIRVSYPDTHLKPQPKTEQIFYARLQNEKMKGFDFASFLLAETGLTLASLSDREMQIIMEQPDLRHFCDQILAEKKNLAHDLADIREARI
jgi:hypothetical protein